VSKLLNLRSELDELIRSYAAMTKPEKKSDEGFDVSERIHELRQELAELESQIGYNHEHY
jgi:predicted nuclease with TOPRIM domain